MPQKITPALWFDTESEEAVAFYLSVFKSSRVVRTTYYPEGAMREAGTVMSVDFELDGQRFTAINGGPQFPFTEAVSFQVGCADQAEVDYYWNRLTDGGEEGQCGWLKDRFGVSWQVAPEGMDEAFGFGDPERSRRVMEAMLTMRKLDLEALRRAGAEVPND